MSIVVWLGLAAMILPLQLICFALFDKRVDIKPPEYEGKLPENSKRSVDKFVSNVIEQLELKNEQ